MVEDEEFFPDIDLAGEIDLSKALDDFFLSGRIEPGRDQSLAEWIDVIASRATAHKNGLEQGGAAAHERIVDGFAGRRQMLDEEPW